MTAYGSVPSARQKLLCKGTLLQVNFSLPVYYMQVHDGMQQEAAAVHIRARSASDYFAVGLNNGQDLAIKGCGAPGIIGRGQRVTGDLCGRVKQSCHRSLNYKANSTRTCAASTLKNIVSGYTVA